MTTIKRAAVGLILCLSVLLMSGCSEEPKTDRKPYTVEWPAHITTGYEWRYSANPSDIVKEVSAEYLPSDAAGGLAGAGGTQRDVFEGVHEGEVVLTFTYARPWESVQPAQIKKITLSVNRSFEITQISQE